jgi:MFS family permease
MIVDKRLLVSMITGALLGVVCILGANLRYQDSLETWYLFAFWFNRFLMGLMIGLIPINGKLSMRLLKGSLLGLIVSFAFYSATDYLDLMGFLVGALYGAIIVVANDYVMRKINQE